MEEVKTEIPPPSIPTLFRSIVESGIHWIFSKRTPKPFTATHVEDVERVKKCSSHYEVLNVPTHANQTEIKKAYLTLALRLHPDKNPLADAEGAFKALQQAYQTLSDDAERQKYDMLLAAEEQEKVFRDDIKGVNQKWRWTFRNSRLIRILYGIEAITVKLAVNHPIFSMILSSIMSLIFGFSIFHWTLQLLYVIGFFTLDKIRQSYELQHLELKEHLEKEKEKEQDNNQGDAGQDQNLPTTSTSFILWNGIQGFALGSISIILLSMYIFWNRKKVYREIWKNYRQWALEMQRYLPVPPLFGSMPLPTDFPIFESSGRFYFKDPQGTVHDVTDMLFSYLAQHGVHPPGTATASSTPHSHATSFTDERSKRPPPGHKVSKKKVKKKK